MPDTGRQSDRVKNKYRLPRVRNNTLETYLPFPYLFAVPTVLYRLFAVRISVQSPRVLHVKQPQNQNVSDRRATAKRKKKVPPKKSLNITCSNR